MPAVELVKVAGLGDSKVNMIELQEKFGRRPGDYMMDPFWFRRGIGDKPYLWDAVKKKWRLVRLGDKFDWDPEGNVVLVEWER